MEPFLSPQGTQQPHRSVALRRESRRAIDPARFELIDNVEIRHNRAASSIVVVGRPVFHNKSSL